MRVAHIITRMIIGGAQENTLFTCQDLLHEFQDEVLLITGPAVGPEGDLLTPTRLREVPVRLIASLRRSIHPWRDARSFGELKQVLREYQPDVVHTHSAKGGFLGRLAATAVKTPAIIHTVHGAPFHAFQSRGARTLFRWCETHAARRCDRLVSVADAMTDQLVAAGVAAREKFVTVYSGMDVDPFLHAEEHRASTRERLGLSDEHVVFGKVARLFHLKGHQFLIDAASQLILQFPQARFLLVGDGILKSELQRRIRERGLDDHFIFTGLVPPEEIPILLGAIDVLVHCSLREGLARALPQALIAARPVVSYDIDGAREVVIPDKTGVLLPPRSVDELAKAMLQLARDPALRHSLGARGRRQFTDTFRHQTMTNRLRAIYEEVLQAKRAT